MFEKVLIANRGEIACRVMDSCRKMGILTVAIFSDADRGSRHVEMADEAVYVGPSPVSQSYLKIDAILAAAKQTGAQAIHPGFGFLSENPEFVEAVQKEGLTFIGPSAEAMRAMGLKDAAKALMEKAGVPVVPGYHGERQEADFLKAEADKIGYPVLIKARAGGGGKGMRRVDDPKDFHSALESAVREGQSSFGDGRVLIEKYIHSPRHIEVQVFGDSHGNVLHLFERDCSLQRRHQKVIEEAPAPGMSEVLREAMTKAAVRAAKAIDYEGAGTIEFIVNGETMNPEGFWFMEMNTRLQVEHPVSEAITGVDLVEWQLRVANGEPLPLSQTDLAICGHAFEARVYAEDPAEDFLPATGQLTALHFPDNARIETGVRSGDAISPHYDPMIAKIITHGATREEALFKLENALKATRILGCTNNIEFLQALASHGGFKTGEVDTGLIARDREQLVREVGPDKNHVAAAALLAFGALSHADPLGSWQLWGRPSRPVTLKTNRDEIRLRVSQLAQNIFEMKTQEGKDRVRLERQEGNTLYIERDGLIQAVERVRTENEISIWSEGKLCQFFLEDGDISKEAEAASSNQTLAPMPGTVTACHVAKGDAVQKGQALLVMEAMKMEHVLNAQMDGVVEEISAEIGASVDKGAILVTLGQGS